ncbi:MAG: hypothetical protein GY754_12070, partial [bacterium]|nr:hypothetical protein [bacterium]
KTTPTRIVYVNGYSKGTSIAIDPNSPIPEGWVKTTPTRIVYVDGYSKGTSIAIDPNSPIPEGWVKTTPTRIVYVEGYSKGTSIAIDPNSPIPKGWVKTTPTRIVYVNGYSKGTSIAIDPNSPIPEGWVRTSPTRIVYVDGYSKGTSIAIFSNNVAWVEDWTMGFRGRHDWVGFQTQQTLDMSTDELLTTSKHYMENLDDLSGLATLENNTLEIKSGPYKHGEYVENNRIYFDEGIAVSTIPGVEKRFLEIKWQTDSPMGLSSFNPGSGADCHIYLWWASGKQENIIIDIDHSVIGGLTGPNMPSINLQYEDILFQPGQMVVMDLAELNENWASDAVVKLGFGISFYSISGGSSSEDYYSLNGYGDGCGLPDEYNADPNCIYYRDFDGVVCSLIDNLNAALSVSHIRLYNEGDQNPDDFEPEDFEPVD